MLSLKRNISASISAMVLLLTACAQHTDENLLNGVPVPYEHMKTVSVTNDMDSVIKSGEIDIYEAYARALKTNLSGRFDKMYKIMKQDLSLIEDYTLLPRIVALSGYNVRYSPDWNGLMYSNRLSNEKGDSDVASSSLGAAINVLDFSIVYSSAKSMNDYDKIVESLKRILIKNIIHDTRIAFLKAVAGQRIKKEADRISSELVEALAYIKNVEESPDFKGKIADYKQSLLDNLSQVNALRREIAATKIRLSGMIGVDPDSEFVVIVPKDMDNPYIYKNLDLKSMESFALNNRSEAKLYSEASVSPADVRAKAKDLFPRVEFGVDLNVASDNYLLNHMWGEVGIKTGWNLLHMASIGVPTGLTENELRNARSTATKIAILAGVDMAYRNLDQAYQEYRISCLLDDISRNVYQKADASATGSNRFDVIGRNIEWLFSRLKKDYAYAYIKDAESSLHVALGVETTPPLTMSSNVSSIARSIEERLVPTEYADKEYSEIMDLKSAGSSLSQEQNIPTNDDEVKKKVDEWLKSNNSAAQVEKKVTPKRVVSKKGIVVAGKNKKKNTFVKSKTSGNAFLQLGSYSRPESAERAWNSVFSKLRPLDGYSYSIKDVEVNGKNYYRLMVNGNRDELTTLCQRIRSTIKSCLIK